MKILLPFLLIAFGADAQTSSSQTNRLEGQIFITRKDRETVKMSGVVVKLVHSTNYIASLQQILSYQQARRNDEKWRERATALVNAMPRMSSKDRAIADKTYASLRAQIITNAPLAKLGDQTSFELFSDIDWNEALKIQTDADGNFSMNVPSGSWKLVALARRKLLDNEEKYVWIVDAPSEGKILLNNSNLWGG